jgi:hypothetical protein
MAFDSDVSVKGAALDATTVINAARARLKGFIVGKGASGSDGTVTFSDGGVAKFQRSRCWWYIRRGNEYS